MDGDGERGFAPLLKHFVRDVDRLERTTVGTEDLAVLLVLDKPQRRGDCLIRELHLGGYCRPLIARLYLWHLLSPLLEPEAPVSHFPMFSEWREP